jgi:hypothetical protein
MFIRAIALCLAALLAACGSAEWRKPGADEAMQSRDIDACRSQARVQSYRDIDARLISRPYTLGVDPRNPTILVPPGAAEGDRMMTEQVMMQNCMRSLGYELAPRGESPQGRSPDSPSAKRVQSP